ncbi:MAG: hypothetical protein K2F65_00505 [Eubacterium sp.]|nr:hypothetical protein [Eubacterium sp.]
MVSAIEKARVSARKAVESQYDGVCTIVERQKVLKANKSTGFEDVIVAKSLPCRLSFKTKANADKNEIASSVSQIIEVFLNPEITVKAGSKLIITQNGVTTEYKSSGQPAVYSTHQEIVLELFKEWA